MKIKKNNMIYSKTDNKKISDFTKWATDTKALVAPFKAEMAKTPVNNRADNVQAMKTQASQMARCLTSKSCRAEFIKHTIEAKKASE